ncbi:hypothetical protein A2U01_0112695, partial [Trifolium medium]|nr:hypothetical protein [Trifolium medium]
VDGTAPKDASVGLPMMQL